MKTDEKVNILIVDDRPENLVALESVLESLGQKVVRASSGLEALKHVLHEEFAVILLDVQMPGMDGFETATLIRARERSQHTPIIFLTAINKTDTHVARGYKVGAVDYVFKPFQPEVLCAKATAFVELFKKTKALEEQVEQRTQAELRLDASNALLQAISQGLVGFIRGQDPADTFRQLLVSGIALTGSEGGFVCEVRRSGARTAPGLCVSEGMAAAREPEERAPDRRRSRTAAGPLLAGYDWDWAALCSQLEATRSPLLINEPEQIPQRQTLPPPADNSTSLMLLPFFKGERLAGVLGFVNRPEGYHDEDARCLEPLAHTCASLMDAYNNAERRKQAEREVRKLNADLERRVEERTAELGAANRELENEIAERRRVEEERLRLLALEQAARGQVEEAQRRLEFLGEASAALAGSLDLETTLEQVTSLSVPFLGDFCILDLLGEDEKLRCVATAHVDPGKAERMKQLQTRYPLAPGAPEPSARVVETGRSEVYGRIDEAWFSAQLRHPEQTEVFRELAPGAYLAVPLVARGRVIGALSFGLGEERGARSPGYMPEDVDLAEDLARRAAGAIDNARLFRDLEEAGRRKDEFLAMLAHELRNPLAAISNAEYVLDGIHTEDQRVLRLRSIISRQAQHLSRLVDDLLDISRITRGKIDLRMEPVELSAVTQRSVESVSPLIEAYRHELTVDMPAELWVQADPTRLEQVLTNLLNNAAKYTEPGGRIDIRARRLEDEVLIAVRDSGIGMSAELLPHVFDLFTQAERSLDRAQGGLGIGLALVRRLVRLHGGEAAAYSEGPGRGSEFVVRLPALASSFAVPAPARELQESAASSGLRVLVVEDNRDAAETLTDILELWGHEVRAAHTGPAAVEEAARYRPDIVLLDIGLPGMDGYEVARALRADGALSGTRLVALTGYGQDEDRRRAEAAGFDQHLTKPVDPEKLRRVLSTGVQTL